MSIISDFLSTPTIFTLVSLHLEQGFRLLLKIFMKRNKIISLYDYFARP